MYDHVLIDGKNMLYRVVFAAEADPRFKENPDTDQFVIFMRLLSGFQKAFKPKNVHLFWDDYTKNSWRRQVFPAYKKNRPKTAAVVEEGQVNIFEIINRQMEITIHVCNNIGIRQYFRKGQEADDLIYSFCYTHPDDKILIISSDGDLKQMLYKMPNVDMHNPLDRKHKTEPRPIADPAIYKALMGDKADNINGYYRIGKRKSFDMAMDQKRMDAFLASEKAVSLNEDGTKTHHGPTLYERNKLLIDLSRCPHLEDNNSYILKRHTSPIAYNCENVIRTLRKYKVKGMIEELGTFVVPFKDLTRNHDDSHS